MRLLLCLVVSGVSGLLFTGIAQAAAPANTTPPSISGANAVGNTLTEVAGVWNPPSASAVTYQWEDCSGSPLACTAISGATSSTYTVAPGDEGYAIEVQETADDASSPPLTATASSAPDLPAIPTNASAPTISGTDAVGNTLSDVHGTWTNAPSGAPTTYTYQWERCSGSPLACSAIAGATGQTYTVASADAGYAFEVLESASNTGGAGAAASSGAVLPAVPTNTAAPTITGTVQLGQTLTEGHGTWTNGPMSYTYQWERCSGSPLACSAIAGATGQTYVLTSADAGFTIEVDETATNAGGASAAASSAGVALTAPPASQSAPTISGTTVQGDVLTEHHGTWTNSPTSYTYEWLRCNSAGASCTAIAGATAQTYTLTAADVGGELVMLETATNAGGSGAAYSALSSIVLSPALVVPVPVNSAAPTISGLMEEGQTLVESHGTWSDNPGTFSYQWQRCGGGGCVAIPGANNQTYTLTGADVGQGISVVETAANTGGSGAAVASIRTSVIIASSSITLALAPNSAVTNQTVTLAATVTSGSGNAGPVGSVIFSNGGVPIAGCASQNVNTGNQSVATICQASFGAGTHQLTVSYQPAAGSLVGASSSAVQTLVVGKVSTSVSLAVTKQVAVRKNATFVATVVPPAGNSGPMLPTGSVAFFDHGRQIAGCHARPMKKGAATCMVKYAAVGSHRISARYLGDANFRSSASAARTVLAGKNAAGPVVLGFISSTVQWKFYFHPKYTQILSLQASGVANASTVRISCHGTSCPFTTLSSTASAASGCSARGHVICTGSSGINLLPVFRNRHLRPGTQIVLWITRPNWIGKYYSFTIRAGQAPLIDLSCVAVGRGQPGVGC